MEGKTGINSKRAVFLCTEFNMGMGKEAIKRMEALSAESDEDILIVISSYGGCCRTMLAIRDAMKRSRCRINTLVLGKAMSAGCYILVTSAATGVRAVTKDCQIMIHGPNGVAPLNEKGLGNMEYYYDVVKEHFKEDANFDDEKLDQHLDRDFYFMGDQAVELGYADVVL
ncbi:ATP-dependent Clp protease proteolytic subunit 1 [Vibrio phage vB_VpaM_sm033]|nr:ATP-dependent Clp protease proteolytic subunit 1 [Vibrio phage vB_VpaM_sm033]